MGGKATKPQAAVAKKPQAAVATPYKPQPLTEWAQLGGAWMSPEGQYVFFGDSWGQVSYGSSLACYPTRVTEVSFEDGGLYFKIVADPAHVFVKLHTDRSMSLYSKKSKSTLLISSQSQAEAAKLARSTDLDLDAGVNGVLANAGIDGCFTDRRFTLDPTYNRFYVHKSSAVRNTTLMNTYFDKPLMKNGMPYFCPSGFKRFSIKVDMKGWEECPVVYHGTDPSFVNQIVSVGFKANTCQHGEAFAYFSPSIVYSAHPRYAKVHVKDGKFTQVVLEVRLKKPAIAKTDRETMFVGDQLTIDPNFPGNEGLEFLVKPLGKNYVTKGAGALVTAIMVRSLPFDPVQHPTSAWWGLWRARKTLHEKYYNPAQPGFKESA